LYFLGYEPKSNSSKRQDLINRLELSQDDLTFWKSFQEQWKDDGFIYLGKWEKHFMMLGKLFQKLTFKSLLPLFATRDMEEQTKVMSKYWSDSFFKFYTKIVMNEWVANKLLYKGSFAGAKDKKTMKVSAADYISCEFSDLFKNTWVKSNYFLQLIFLNKVTFKEAFPAECDESLFNKIKASTTIVFFHQGNLLEFLKVKPHDFYSLSDTFSYMKDEDVSGFLESLPSDIKPHTNMVIRTFMRSPSFKVVPPWETNSELNSKLAKEDCTRMYEFRVLSKQAFSK
jgi:S-adenosylmethionine:diacylglycerol 3-amino-3-carboxypropyl transferase